MTPFVRWIAGRAVTAMARESQRALAEDVLSAVERLAGKGGLREGLRVRFGWSLLSLREHTDGLIVCEPDFDGDPLRAVRPRIDATLDVLAEQAALVRRVGVEPVEVGFEQFVVVARGALDARTLHLFRSGPPAGEDSGWSIALPGASGDEEEAFEAARVHTFLRLRRAVLSVMLLPPEFAAVVEGEHVAHVLDPEGRDRLAG